MASSHAKTYINGKCYHCGQAIKRPLADIKEVIVNCRKQGATDNELQAAAWLEDLLAERRQKS
jgi:hypothetical protein